MLDSKLYQDDLQKLNEQPFPWDKLEHKNVLITGGTGLIGSCFADALIWRNEHKDAGIGIWILCRNEARAREIFGAYLDKEYVHLMIQDISKPLLPETFGQGRRSSESVKMPEKMDYIIHAAGKGDPKSFVIDPLGVMNANLLGMYQVITYARGAETQKILYLSSGEAYGRLELPENVPISESMTGMLDCLNVRNCYGISKRAAETMCVSAVSEYRLPACIARLCHTYGPTMMEGENRVVFQFIGNALRGEDIVLKSAGAQRRSYCYVADAVRGLLGILFYGEAGEAYNVSNRRSVVTIRELAQIAAAYAGCSVHWTEQTDEEKKGDSGIMHAVLDDRKLAGLGVKMEYDMKTGLLRTLEILKECGKV